MAEPIRPAGVAPDNGRALLVVPAARRRGSRAVRPGGGGGQGVTELPKNTPPTVMAEVWHSSAFWYLAGLEDSRRGRRGKPFPHGPTTESGREFIRTYVEACAADVLHYGPYLPDLYRDWEARNRKSQNGLDTVTVASIHPPRPAAIG